MQFDPDQIERDYVTLITSICGMAQHLLVLQNGFIPIAAAIDSNGKLSHIGQANGPEITTAQEEFNFFRESLQAALDQNVYRTIAIAVDVNINNPEYSGGIQIVVATKIELGKRICVPYKKTSDGYELGKPFPS